jgi:pyruvate dehydrogenase E1 component alpha subunit
LYDIKTLLADRDFCLRTLEYLMLVRKFEERVYMLFGHGKIHGTAHLCIGEEATGIGTTFALKSEDCMLASHRGHGQAIGKGIPINEIMAEMLGKETGVNRGRGGSMHIADIRHGVLGANGIMGASGPLACGAALFFKMKKMNDRVVAFFFGDGSSNLGAIHESMNLAAAWKLPVMFVLTNNGYGMSTPLYKVVNDTDLTKRAIPFAMKSYEVDGNDVLAVYSVVSEAREYIIETGEPVLIVENTYRTSGHSKSDANKYRTKSEIEEWNAKNPVIRFTCQLLENGYKQKDIDEADRITTEIVENAVEYALSSPEPEVRDFEAAAYAK